jgi:hypothetical protein
MKIKIIVETLGDRYVSSTELPEVAEMELDKLIRLAKKNEEAYEDLLDDAIVDKAQQIIYKKKLLNILKNGRV